MCSLFKYPPVVATGVTKFVHSTLDTFLQHALELEKKLCECGMHIRRDWLTRHKNSACHQDFLKQKENLNRELTNVEVDAFLRKKYRYRLTSYIFF